MAKQPGRPLSAAFLRTVKTPGRYGDGRGSHGLYLRVWVRKGSGRVARSWGQRISVAGRRTNLGLGGYPVVTLVEARAKALANRRAVEQGRDPRGDKTMPTFEVAAEKVVVLHSKTWKAGSRLPEKWRASFRRYAFPRIGQKRVDQITTTDVLAVLTPIWHDKHETAREVRSRVGTVMKWAVAKNYRQDNPAGDAISAALPRKNGGTVHLKALPHADVAKALAKVRGSDSSPAVKLALEMIVLTACRVGEVLGARWTEIDLEGATWTVPASRMKANREHRVALSTRAVQVLTEARSLSGGRGFVFPGSTGRKISRTTLADLLTRVVGVAGTTLHGFRSSFRDWCAEASVDREVAEAALAHTVRNQVEAAYFRSDLFDRRRDVMAAWASACS